jgi:hypothetical protein
MWQTKGISMPEPKFLGFGWGGMFPYQSGGMAPHWLFTTLSASAAIALRPPPRYRFSLFDLFTLTTFAAILASSVAWLGRFRP